MLAKFSVFGKTIGIGWYPQLVVSWRRFEYWYRLCLGPIYVLFWREPRED